MKIFCVPFSGGGRYSYRDLEQVEQKGERSKLSFTTLELPGHGLRMGEELLKDATKMAQDLLQHPSFSCQAPYALFGHSLGGLLVYLMAKELQKRETSKNWPLHLFISGCMAPSRPPRLPLKHQLPADEFFAYLRFLGGFSEEFLADPELMQLFAPILRADIEARENYIYQGNDPPLSAPITLLYGDKEGLSEEDLADWQLETTAEIKKFSFPGNHFFLLEQSQKISQVIAATLGGGFGRDFSSLCSSFSDS